ncbi:Uncharacterised protein [Candidatus Burarchaeum australiense]|nr:Uncharacterised protein [Candidatus Burarchaeum australiense]
MGGIGRGQALTLEAVLALFIAILFIYLLLGTGTNQTWDMQLERAGYDCVNAIYLDNDLHDALMDGSERGAYTTDETLRINGRLAQYADLLGLGEVDVAVEGAGTFSGTNENAPEPLDKETFYALLPLRGGEDNRLVTVTVWT